MFEQPRPPGTGPEKKDAKETRVPRFTLHGQQMKDGKMVETDYPLTAVFEAEALDPKLLAKEFVEEHDKPPGRDRTPQAAWQNRIARAILNGRVSADFLKRIKEECNKLGRQVTREVQLTIDGIESNLNAVNRLMGESERERRGSDAGYMLAMNDVIDGRDKIDLVDFGFVAGLDGSLTVPRLRLIQVKSSEVTDQDEREILMAHRDFYDRLLGPEMIADRLLEQEIRESVRTGTEFEKGLQAPDPEKRVGFMVSHFGDFIADYLSVFGDGPKGSAETTIAACRNCPPTAILKLFFDEKGSYHLFRTIAESLWVSEEERADIDSAYQQLRRWAAANPTTRDDLRSLRPDWKPPKSLMQAMVVESVIMHGPEKSVSKRVTRPLGGRKALTRK